MKLAPTLTSEPRHFIIRGLFRTLKYSKVRRYLEIWKLVPGYNCFCRTLILRLYLDVWQNSKYTPCIYKCYLAWTVILGSASGIFRHIRPLFKSIHTYSELCVSLVYSEPWHVPVTKHIQIPRYIQHLPYYAICHIKHFHKSLISNV